MSELTNNAESSLSKVIATDQLQVSTTERSYVDAKQQLLADQGKLRQIQLDKLDKEIVEAKKKFDKELSPQEVIKFFKQNFKRIDENQNGVLEWAELTNAKRDGNFTGVDAQIMGLNCEHGDHGIARRISGRQDQTGRLFQDLANLVPEGDTILSIEKGISKKDLATFEACSDTTKANAAIAKAWKEFNSVSSFTNARFDNLDTDHDDKVNVVDIEKLANNAEAFPQAKEQARVILDNLQEIQKMHPDFKLQFPLFGSALVEDKSLVSRDDLNKFADSLVAKVDRLQRQQSDLASMLKLPFSQHVQELEMTKQSLQNERVYDSGLQDPYRRDSYSGHYQPMCPSMPQRGYEGGYGAFGYPYWNNYSSYARRYGGGFVYPGRTRYGR